LSPPSEEKSECTDRNSERVQRGEEGAEANGCNVPPGVTNDCVIAHQVSAALDETRAAEDADCIISQTRKERIENKDEHRSETEEGIKVPFLLRELLNDPLTLLGVAKRLTAARAAADAPEKLVFDTTSVFTSEDNPTLSGSNELIIRRVSLLVPLIEEFWDDEH